MRIPRSNLTVLLNALAERTDGRFTISHPADELGSLVTVELEGSDDCRVIFEMDKDEYDHARRAVQRHHPAVVADDLPDPRAYANAFVASGIIDIDNLDDLRTFVERYGDPDLSAGHRPVFAGFDTNLMPWRLDEVLGLRAPTEGIGYVNGFVLASGVRAELDWDYKCHDSGPFVEAFGDAFDVYWNQPLGDARIGRLGHQQYRAIRDIEQAVEVESDPGDEAIIEAYAQYQATHRGDVLLFSNDRNFVERAQGHTILSQFVELPRSLPRNAMATWEQLERLLYTLTVIFGVLEVPTMTLHGVWSGKDGLDWQHERLRVDCRSPPLRDALERDMAIVDAYRQLLTD